MKPTQRALAKVAAMSMLMGSMACVKKGQTMTTKPDFIEETCPCGRVWRGKPGCSLGCPDCHPVDEDELEEWYFRYQRKIAERNEY